MEVLPPPGLGRHADLNEAHQGVDQMGENVVVCGRPHTHLEEKPPVHRGDEERPRSNDRVQGQIHGINVLMDFARAGNK